MDKYACPYCGASLAENNFSKNLIDDPVTDLLGKEIRNHYIGNCPECWRLVEIINGAIAKSAFIIEKQSKE